MPDYQDFGALWPLPNDAKAYSGALHAIKVIVRPNERKEQGDKFPDFHVYAEGTDTKIGAIWKKVSKTGVDFLTGEITILGSKTNIALWPAKQTSERSPAFRVMPPQEERQPVAAVPQPDEDWDADIPF